MTLQSGQYCICRAIFSGSPLTSGPWPENVAKADIAQKLGAHAVGDSIDDLFPA
jgi:hypothetical protein